MKFDLILYSIIKNFYTKEHIENHSLTALSLNLMSIQENLTKNLKVLNALKPIQNCSNDDNRLFIDAQFCLLTF